MKFLVVGDLHGRKPKIHFRDFDAILAVGDFCPLGRIRELMFEVIRIKQKESNLKIHWYDLVGKREGKRLIVESIKIGRKILEFLNSFEKPVYFVPGNAEWTGDKEAEWNFLKKNNYTKMKLGLKNLLDVHEKIKNLDGYQIIGYGLNSGPEYPQYKEDIRYYKPAELKKRKREYEKLLAKYDKLFKKAKNKKNPIIFLAHNVPFNTPLDKITDKKSPRYGYHYGSLVVREMVEKYQPLVCIGGHIHEHFGKCKIGKTTIINAGFGSYVNVLMEVEENKIKRLEFHRGKQVVT